MDDLILSFCGLNCKECPVFIATVTNDNELKQKTADEWGDLYSEYIGKKELTVEDMICQGCKSDGDIRFIGCNNCPIRNCCIGKNFATCAECNEYERCEMINGFFTTAPQAKENLNKIRTNIQK